MRNFITCVILVLCIHCQAAEVRSARIWGAPDNTRVVFDLSAPVQHSLSKMANPHRVVLDIKGARLERPPGPVARNGYLVRIRAGQRDQNNLRIVLDLYEDVAAKSFLVEPNGQYGHRLVIDLIGRKKGPSPIRDAVTAAPRAVESGYGTGRDVVVAIDAGHGGEDPGAIGQRGTREKDVALIISRKLAALVRQERGMRAVLIRDGDYFVGLRDRMRKAREHRADLFVSIHADAVTNRHARGSSVYVLSERGASTEQARWLAERENASDLVGGVSLDVKDDMLKAVLLDLSQAGVMDASYDVAGQVLQRLTKVGDMHSHKVQAAGFMVLKSPDIPSLLIETAFISNPGEEEKLNNPRYQNQLTQAIMEGIRSYFRDRAPPGTRLAMSKDVLQR